MEKRKIFWPHRDIASEEYDLLQVSLLKVFEHQVLKTVVWNLNFDDPLFDFFKTRIKKEV